MDEVINRKQRSIISEKKNRNPHSPGHPVNELANDKDKEEQLISHIQQKHRMSKKEAKQLLNRL